MRSSEQRWRHRVRIAGAGILVSSAIALGVMIASSPTGTWYTMASGVLGSLIASFLLLIVSELVGPAPRYETAASEQLTDAAESLKTTAGVMQQAARHSLIAVKPKTEFSRDEWREVLKTRSHLVLVGHALDTWCQHGIKSDFEAALARVATEGEGAKLLTLPTRGRNVTRVERQRGKTYADRVRNTHAVVAGVYQQLPENAQRRLCAFTLAPEIEMPYMLVANEHIVFTCTYPAALQNSDPMLTAAGYPSSKWGSAILEDVNQMLRKYGHPVDLSRPAK